MSAAAVRRCRAAPATIPPTSEATFRPALAPLSVGTLRCRSANSCRPDSAASFITGTSRTSWLALSLVEVGAISSFFLLAVALNRGPLALVSVISSNVAVFTLIYAALFGGLLKVPNVPAIGIAWQHLVACLAFMAVGTLALSS